MELDFQPEMVGREEELKQLQDRLNEASDGQGKTILIAGEAGVGKTRLINELKDIALSKGFQVMLGSSMYESLTPYMPIMEALRSGGIETLFAEETPRIEGLYLVTHEGLLAKEVLREETGLDPDLFSSMLSTVGDFVRDSLSMMTGEEREGALNTLGYENYRIIISSGMSANLVAILSGRENEFLVNDMSGVLSEVHRDFGGVLKDWDGDTDKLKGLETLIKPLITSGKYDGIHYGMDDPEGRRNLLFENVSLGLMRQARTTPTLLCIEDLHWADPSSLAMMHYVARNTRKCNLLVLGTYRPEDVGDKEGKPHPLVETMQLMSREDLYERMELDRLPRENLGDFLSSLLGEVDLSDELEDLIYRETEGNPLFMLELVKLLVDEGAISPQDGIWRLARDVESVDVPTKIHDVIVRRLDRVKQEQRKILDYASVIGDAFTSIVLSEILKLDRVELLEQLKVLQKTHRLIHPFNGCFRFDHAKIKEVLYEETPEELRTEYHRMIADAIERQNEGNLDDVIEDLAYHYYRCGDKEKALPYLRSAAEKAKKEYSNEEAIRFYSEALELETDSEKRADVFEAIGDLYELIGQYDRSIESCERALELIERKNRRAAIKAKIGDRYRMSGEYDKSKEACDEALNLVREEGSKEEALALSSRGHLDQHFGELDEALENLQGSLQILERIGDRKGIARVIGSISSVQYVAGEFEKSLESGRESLRISEEVNDQRGIAGSLRSMGMAYLAKGEFDKAIEHYERSLVITEKIGDQAGISESLNSIGLVYSNRGDFDKSLEYFEKSLKIERRTGNLHQVARHLGNIGITHRFRGDVDKGLEYLDKALRMYEKIQDQQGIAISFLNKGVTYAESKDYDRAIEYSKKSLEICDKLGFKRVATYCYLLLGHAHLKMGKLEKAMDMTNAAHDLSEEIGYTSNVAGSRKLQGMIYREQCEWEKSLESFEESIKIFSDIGMERELGSPYLELGLMWKKKGDITKARANLQKAMEIQERVGRKDGVEEAREALKSLDQGPTSPPPD